MRFSHFFILMVLFLVGCSCKSWAEIFRWTDPVAEITLNYPDRWDRVHNQQPDDVFTVAAPSLDDYATCRIRIRDDKRFTIYPRKYAASIQRLNYSRGFWEDYLTEYRDVSIVEMVDDAGFGRGFGSLAEATYMPQSGTKIEKRALLAAAPYYDKVYIFECSAAENAYGRWYPGFMNILRSVDFKKLYHGHPNGEYRNFIGDPLLHIHGRRTEDLYIQ